MSLAIDHVMGIKECKRFLIEQIFVYYLNRPPTKEELEYHQSSEDPLELVCLNIIAANLGKVLSVEAVLPITLAMFVKDAANSIHIPINSVKGLVREIVVVDTGSTDGTPEIARSFGARVYHTPFTDFGSIRTLTAHLARQPWVLMLDADEELDPDALPLLSTLVLDSTVDAWGLPRRRWADIAKTQQEELEAYPDWQYRLFRNKPEIAYEKRVHEALVGAAVTKKAEGGPHIEHFQSVFKKGPALAARNDMYRKLYALDVRDGVVHKGPAIAEIDEVSK